MSQPFILSDHDGYQVVASGHAPAATLDRLDVWLDRFDAAHEDSDGLLPHQETSHG